MPRVEVPPLRYQNCQVDVQIRIHREDANYHMDLFAWGQEVQAPIKLTPHDVDDLNRRLQNDMRAMTRAFAHGEGSRRERLRTLAESGHYAFTQVFKDSKASDAIQRLLKLKSSLNFQITTEDFFLPWETFYTPNLSEPIIAVGFWGMTHTITRIIVQVKRSGAFASPTIEPEEKPTLGLLTYDKLTAVRREEVPFFEQLADKGRISLKHLRPLDPKKKATEWDAFREFWKTHLDLAHFACHAETINESQPDAQLRLRNEFAITLMDLTNYGFSLEGHPLVVLNACNTGVTNPLYTSHFVRAVLEHGALGVVATECQIPDVFAAQFTKKFYEYFLSGLPVGSSLLKARQFFLDENESEDDNPSGLAYAMYGSAIIRLVVQQSETSMISFAPVVQQASKSVHPAGQRTRSSKTSPAADFLRPSKSGYYGKRFRDRSPFSEGLIEHLKRRTRQLIAADFLRPSKSGYYGKRFRDRSPFSERLIEHLKRRTRQLIVVVALIIGTLTGKHLSLGDHQSPPNSPPAIELYLDIDLLEDYLNSSFAEQTTRKGLYHMSVILGEDLDKEIGLANESAAIAHLRSEELVLDRPVPLDSWVTLSILDQEYLQQLDKPTFTISVHAENIEVSPSWTQSYTLGDDDEYPIFNFILTAKSMGEHSIRADYYFNNQWLAKVMLEVEVIKDSVKNSPPVENFLESRPQSFPKKERVERQHWLARFWAWLKEEILKL